MEQSAQLHTRFSKTRAVFTQLVHREMTGIGGRVRNATACEIINMQANHTIEAWSSQALQLP